MSEPPAPSPRPTTFRPEDATHEHTDGFQLDDIVSGEDEVDRRLAEIEMAGEEVAAGWKPRAHEPLAQEVRFLHCSRTIHELITDRNRSVGIFLFVASLLFGASTALLNAPATVPTIIPLGTIQYWCFPATFLVLAVIGGFMSLILIRTRIGLIYEVAKMNAMLGLPAERVKRVNPFSIFFLMHLLVLVLGGLSAALAVGMLVLRDRRHTALAVGLAIAVGVLYVVLFKAVYFLKILRATSDTELRKAGG